MFALYFNGTSNTTTNAPIDGYIQCLLGGGITVENGSEMSSRYVFLYQGSITFGELDGEGKITIFNVNYPDEQYDWYGQFVGGEAGSSFASSIPDNFLQGFKEYVQKNMRTLILDMPNNPALNAAIESVAQNRIAPRPMLLSRSLENIQELAATQEQTTVTPFAQQTEAPRHSQTSRHLL